jgi:hypothetical protein
MKPATRLVLIGGLLGVGLTCQVILQRYVQAAGPAVVVPLSKPLAELPLVLGDWRGQDQPVEDERELYADEHLKRTYQHRGRRQWLTLWMVYSREGVDRKHNPEICLVSAGRPEEPRGRAAIPVPGHPASVQQYCFGRPGNYQWVYYWHYTLNPPAAADRSPVQRFFQFVRQRPASVTIEVFAPEASSDDAEYAREFVGLVDAAIQDFVGPNAVRGSDRAPAAMLQ